MRRRFFLKLLGFVFPLVILGPYDPFCPFGTVGPAHAARAARDVDKTDARSTALFRLRRERLVHDIRGVLGRPYRWGAAGPGAFASLIFWRYARAGIRIPRTARQQGSVGLRVQANPVFWDVLLFRSKASPSGWHTSLYLGQYYFGGRIKGVVVLPLVGYRRRLASVRIWYRMARHDVTPKERGTNGSTGRWSS